MSQAVPLTFPVRLLAKALIKRATRMSGTAFAAQAELGFARDEYIIKVLEAPSDIRDQVKDNAVALLDDNPNLQPFVALLLMFEALPENLKADFIVNYKGTATLLTQGSREIVRAHIHDPENLPPRQEP